MRYILCTIFLLFFCRGIHGQNPVARVMTYGGGLLDEGRQILELEDGGFVIVGTTASTQENNTDMYLIRLDNDLNCIWSRAYGSAGLERGYSVCEFEGGFVLVGYTNKEIDRGYDVYVVRTDEDGILQWQRNFGGAEWDFGRKVVAMADGIFVAGSSFSGDGGEDGYLIQVDSEGNLMGEWRLGGDFTDAFLDMETQSDTIWLAGASRSDQGELSSRGWLIAMNEGEIVSERFFDEYESTFVNDVFIRDGQKYIGMGFEDSGEKRSLLVKLTSSELVDWQQLDDYQWSVRTAVTDDYVLTVGPGDAFGAGGVASIIYRRDLGGNWISGAAFGGAFDDYPMDLLLGSSGRVYLLGSSSSYSEGGDEDVYLVEFSSDSIVAEYDLEVNHLSCIGELGIDDEVISDFQSILNRQGTIHVYTLNGQLLSVRRGLIIQSDIEPRNVPVIISIVTEEGDIFRLKIL